MKNKVLILALVVILLGVGLVYISNDSAPGDPLYALDRGVEGIEIKAVDMFAGDIALTEKHLALAEERVDELVKITGSESAIAFVSKVAAQDMDVVEEMEDEEIEIEIEMLVDDYEQHLADAEVTTLAAKEEGLDTEELEAKVAGATFRHQEVLGEVYERVPDQAKQAIVRAMERASNRYQNTIKSMEGEKAQEIKEENAAKAEEMNQGLENKKAEVEEIKNSGAGNSPDDAGQPESAGQPEGTGQPEGAGQSETGGGQGGN